jgi:hypothetical protein
MGRVQSGVSPLAIAKSPRPSNRQIQRMSLYTHRRDWQCATTQLATIDFQDLAPPRGTRTFNTWAGLTRCGVKFVGLSRNRRTYRLVVVSSINNPYVLSWGPGDKLQGGGTNILISLPSGITALGWDMMITFQAFIPSISYYTVVLNGQEEFGNLVSCPPPPPSFVGVVANTPLYSIEIISNDTFPMLNNFTIGRIQ